MAIIIGRCDHGKIVCAALEEMTTREELDDMAAAYTLERAETANMEGRCSLCTARYAANIALLDDPTKAFVTAEAR